MPFIEKSMPPEREPWMGRCGRAEAWVYGWHWVKFADVPEPVKKALIAYHRCPNDATVEHVFDGITMKDCLKHSRDPIRWSVPESIDG